MGCDPIFDQLGDFIHLEKGTQLAYLTKVHYYFFNHLLVKCVNSIAFIQNIRSKVYVVVTKQMSKNLFMDLCQSMSLLKPLDRDLSLCVSGKAGLCAQNVSFIVSARRFVAESKFR